MFNLGYCRWFGSAVQDVVGGTLFTQGVGLDAHGKFTSCRHDPNRVLLAHWMQKPARNLA